MTADGQSGITYVVTVIARERSVSAPALRRHANPRRMGMAHYAARSSRIVLEAGGCLVLAAACGVLSAHSP